MVVGVKHPLRVARVATCVYFILCGSLMSTWVVHIPAIGERAGISHATLGSLLVLLGLGAFIGMQVAGRRPTASGRGSWSPPPAFSVARPWCCPASPGIPGRWQVPCWSSASATAAWT